ncbi:ABC transporter substrate-binding protein [Acidisoma cellulosilytica]|uniref:ABC transporter substrate-binding protein n=1 Tax=Acidisoma cellulosilyticum TaxID=2802395 RepID=A0A964E6N9_9PROT|nr:ABC transporter substrate-binding protein [Acidisoma cellulosilyticum]MCB8883784.1 ABC transporter substrate-binding protein [Acidisoma cellulosilyticum]
MRKIFLRCMVTALAFLPLSAMAQKEPIKIGIVQAQTGALADSFGIPSAQGAILAMEQINARGGIDGRQLVAVSRDDRTSIEPTVIAFQELVRDPDLLAIIGPSTSGAAMAVRQIIDENQIPELSIAYGTALTASNYSWYYRVGPSLETGNQALLAAIVKHLGKGQRLATLALADAGGNDGARDAKRRAPSYGMTAVDSEDYRYGDTDFTAQLTRIKSSGATALLSLTQGIATNAMIRAVEQLGMDKMMIVGPNGLADAQSQALAGNRLNGVVFWDYACLDDPANQNLPALKRDYLARYNKPLSNGAINGYDMMRMIGVSLQSLADENKPLTRANLNDKLDHLSFDGIGTNYRFTSEWHNGPHLEQIPLCTFQNGKRIPWTP